MRMRKNNCKECKEPLTGRIDKKFCSDSCRCSFFNKLNVKERNEFRRINRILKQNRKILKRLVDSGRAKASLEELEIMGFAFGFATEVVVANEGQVKYFCYDIGLKTEADSLHFALVHKEQMPQS